MTITHAWGKREKEVRVVCVKVLVQLWSSSLTTEEKKKWKERERRQAGEKGAD